MKILATAAAIAALGFLGVSVAHADSDLAAKQRADAAAAAAKAKMDQLDKTQKNSPADKQAHIEFWKLRHQQIRIDNAFWKQRNAKIKQDVAFWKKRNADIAAAKARYAAEHKHK